ncbi:MAG: winged helix-turn-helix transcriptional regulator [Candidatus Micrarchaeales archaeon]|nr:winged helix-turn-helix transcriptional regulator [Candidatus Micrarchaeales archaeon]
MIDIGSVECEFNRRYSIVTRRILRMLSENSRITLTEMARELHLSRRSVAKRLKRIEQEFGISYTINISKTRIGLNNPHITLVKFRRRPSTAVLCNLFRKSYIPQLVVPVKKGSYDLLIYSNSTSFRDYANWDRDMRSELMQKYGMKWEQSQIVFTRLGHIPVRNEILQRTRIPERDKKMLMLLNTDSRISLKELAKRMNMNYKTCIYQFNELLKKKYIKRFTIAMEMRESASFMSLFAKYVPSESHSRASSYSRLLFTKDERNPLISRYILKMSLVGTYDSFAIGVFDNFSKSYKYVVQAYKKLMGSLAPTEVEYGELGRPLLGMLPISSGDISKEYASIRRYSKGYLIQK